MNDEHQTSEVSLPAGLPISGVVGADQVKSLDWRIRKATQIDTVSEAIVIEVVKRIHALIASPEVSGTTDQE